ncbi:HAD-IIB family hydrolase [Alicyclobacillus fodiniaquatilis]|jgi:Cof subfamily protein (haloacid dehalogenase superfamily)|uniref:HAD-IIB family hydrolase n=1 Tax=Alicyclobacillus fodiniaquatilis TaxID=1661150 RepID=A0ABW4JL75_9BACL
MVFVFDLDGTICFKGQPVSEQIANQLDALKEAGHEVIFASARPIRDMLPVLPQRFHAFPLVGGNGSLLANHGNIVFRQAFADEQIKTILSIIKNHHATYLIDGDWDYAYTGPKDHPILQNVDPAKLATCMPVEALQTVVKILLLTVDSTEDVVKQLRELDVVIHQHRHEHVIDISPKGVHKWQALQMHGVREGEFIAFGNDANDLTMFQNAKHAVMVGHHDDVAPFANKIMPMDTDVEENIVNELNELARSHTLI